MLTSGWVGLVLCALGGAVVALSSIDAGDSRPAPLLALLGGAAAAGVLGRVASVGASWLAPLLVVAAAGLAVPAFLPDAGEPLAAPLGYANADGTLFAVGALAALALATSREAPAVLRVAAVAGAAGLVAATVATRSAASVAVLLVGAAIVLLRLAHARAAALVAAVGVAASIGITTLLAIPMTGDIEGNAVGVRIALWHDAAAIAADHPFTGIGPGRYELERRVTDDEDLRWAHHGPLQLGAEVGIGGPLLLVAAAWWALARAAQAGATTGGAAAGATTALVVHSCLDYVLHEGALVLVVAFLVGAAVPARPTGVEDHPG